MNIDEIAKMAYTITTKINLRRTCLEHRKWDRLQEFVMERFVLSADYYLHNPQATARDYHEFIYDHKENLGWTCAGVYNSITRTDPLHSPYSELSARDKVVTEMFRIVVGELRALYETKHLTMDSSKESSNVGC